MPFKPDKLPQNVSNATPGFKPDTPGSDAPSNDQGSLHSAAQPSIVEKGLDLIPGMKERRESIAAHRETPEFNQKYPWYQDYKNQGVDPGINMMGMVSEAPIWALAKFIPGVSKMLAPAAERAAIMDLVKNEAELGPAIANKVKAAGEQFTAKQIAPRMEAQYAKSAEQYVPFNKEELMGIHPDIDAKVSELSKYYDKEIPMSEALKLRAQLNTNTLFKNAGPYAETAAARGKAFDAGNKIRSGINQVDPSVGQLSEELRDAYSLRKSVLSPAEKRPISSVEAPLGSDKASLLSQFDQQAGTNLRGLGKNISTAKERLGQVSSMPGSKTDAMKKLMGYIPRAYDATAQSIMNGPNQLWKYIPPAVPAYMTDSRDDEK